MQQLDIMGHDVIRVLHWHHFAMPTAPMMAVEGMVVEEGHVESQDCLHSLG